jgi:tetratricopeptide (TPR) repeat protein
MLMSVLAFFIAVSAEAAAEQSGASDAASLLQEGRGLLDKDQPDAALEKLQQALKLGEGRAEIYFLIGQAYVNKKDYASATGYFSQAIALDPSNVEARRQLAASYESQDQLDEAIAEYSGIVPWTEPGSDVSRATIKKIRYLTATRHAKHQELDAALSLFNELAQEYPEDPLMAYSAGVAYMLKGQMNEAHAMYERVLKLDPDYLNAYLNLATVDEAQGEVDEAVTNLKRIIELSPESTVANKANIKLALIKARMLAQDGNLPDAAAAYDKVLESDPANNTALAVRPGLYRRMNDKEGERKAYEDLVARYPGDAAARTRLADIYIVGGQYAPAYDQLSAVLEGTADDAHKETARKLMVRILSTPEGRRIDRTRTAGKIAALEGRVKQEPDNGAALRDLALAYVKLERYQDALKIIEQLLKLDPEDASTHLGLAGLHDKLGQFKQAVQEYLWLISRTRDAADTKRYVAALKLANAKRLYVDGDLQAAGTEFSEILSEDPANSIAYFYLGLIYSREDDIAGAVDAYKEVVRQVPTHVGARLNLAYSYEKLNREEDAIDEYRKILQANPPPEMVETVRQRLSNVQKRINGISVGLGYMVTYDSNSNLSDTNEAEELRSDLSLNLSYQYKTAGGYRWRLSAQPVYSNYHKAQYDYLNSSETIAVSTVRDALTLVGGYTYRTTDGLMVESRLSRTNTLFAELLSRMKLPNLLRPWAGRVSSGISFNLSYSDFDSSSSPFFSSYTSAGGVSVSQPINGFNTLRLGYSYVLNENKELVGSDYAYTSHGLSAGLDHLMPWGSINLNAGVTLFDYSNPDSYSQFTERRRNFRDSIALGTTYRYKPNISLFATLAWTDNRSNLPVGFILNSEDIIEGQQSSSLSDYLRTLLSAGINLRF